MTEEAGEETAEALELPGKCTRQNVLIVVLKPKYLSNLTRKDRFTAENAFLSTENPEKTDTKPEFRAGRVAALQCATLFGRVMALQYTALFGRVAALQCAALSTSLKRANFELYQ